MSTYLQGSIRGFSREKLLSLLLVLSFCINSLSPQIINAEGKKEEVQIEEKYTLSAKKFYKDGYFLSENVFFAVGPKFQIPDNDKLDKTDQKKEKVKKMQVLITAYSSTVSECDGDPFRTASGSHVRDGIVAANFLPLGSKIRIPKLFKNKIFVVEDRMSKRYWYKVDIWMSSYQEAINFGKKYTQIEVLD